MIMFLTLFCILLSIHSENSIHLGLTVQKFKDLLALFEGAPILVPQILSYFISFFFIGLR